MRRLVPVLLFVSVAFAQPNRLSGPIDARRTKILPGNRNPRIEAAIDRGAPDPVKPLSGITLLFRPSPAQQAELDRLLAGQQDPSSPQYRQWLEPEEFADRFGATAGDIAQIKTWLESQGLTVETIARSRMWISCGGTAARVQAAFHTTLRTLEVDGETHLANVTDPALPEMLDPLVAAIRGLDDFRPKPHSRRLSPRFNSGTHTLGPGDLATIYNFASLWQNGTNGAGQSVAVIGQTAVDLRDIQNYRRLFGLPANDPKMILFGPDPGISTDDIVEANLDLDVFSAVAPYATLNYVYSNNAWGSVQYAVDQKIAPVISMSYGYCEAKISATPASVAGSLRTLAQQANAQGITWMAASGDSGAADCDNGSSAQYGLAVDLPASVPEVTGVGGAEFREGSGSYWSGSNGAFGGSALSYIPEMAWNDTVATGQLGSGGGGSSNFFTKPSWQTGTGVPTENFRHVPDVALAASADHDGYWVISQNSSFPVGGTSAAAPAFSGMVVLLNQYLVNSGAIAKAGLGNINPTLYRLAQTNSSMFHDITAGSNIVPCNIGTPSCTTGSMGFSAGPGYDRATGLGSVDAFRLITGWSGTGVSTAGTTTALAAGAATISAAGTVLLTATVRATSGTATPSGTVSFTAGKTSLGSANLNSAGIATLSVYGSQLAVGANAITATYGGGAGFNGSSGSTSVTVTVPTTSSAVIPSVVPNPVYQQKADADGYTFFFTVRLSEIAGAPTSITDFTFAGASYASSVASFFGSSTIPAHGTVSASLRAKLTTVPSTQVLTFAGVDGAGQPWTQQLSVPFYPQQIAAAMSLASSPGTVVQNPNADPRCQFFQQLNLQEHNGYEVQLTKFLAGSGDYTASIPSWFGGLRLPPFGALQANICWTGVTPPSTINYELDGVDPAGNKIVTTASVPFQAPATNGGALTLSKTSLPLNVSPSQTATGTVNVSVGAGQPWSVSLFPNNQKTSWLVVYPLSGTGPAQINVVASGAGMSNGVYTATLVLQSVNAVPQFVNLPVTFTVGGSTTTVITGLQNAASFRQVFAPGMLMSVYGSRLANATATAQSLPLPPALAGVSATVNGIPAPLWFVSSGQINLQVPYETPAGPAILAINNNGQVASLVFSVAATAPGIFNNSGALTPAASARRGSTISLFMTGEGELTPMLPTGAPPASTLPTDKLPKPRAAVTVTVGGIQADVAFIGNPLLVGVTQINFTVPANVAPGPQPVVVIVGGVPSAAETLTVQ